MRTPDELEWQTTLTAAVVRYDDLRNRDALAPAAELAGERDDPPDIADGPPGRELTRDEALEMLALGEVIVRKASYGRQLSVRTARATGASWSQIGAALGTSKQSAWEAHTRWIEEQAEQHRRSGYQGLDDDRAAAARANAGDPDREPSP